MVRNFIISIILILMSISLSSADNDILAIVNNEIVTRKDLNDFLEFMRIQLKKNYSNEQEIEKNLSLMEEELLQRLIEDRLIIQQAKKESINVDKSLVESRLKEIKKHYENTKDFDNALKMQGLTEADIRNRISEQILISTFIDKKIKPKVFIYPYEINEFYEKNKADFIEQEKRKVFALVFEDEELAKQILEFIKRDGFKKVSRNYLSNLKDLGIVDKDQLRKEIQDIIFNLNLNENSELIKLENLYYIFYIDEIFPSKQREFAEVKQFIYDFLFEKKLKDYLKVWLDEIKNKSYIKIRKN
ncbi:MAG: peptidyl-prolyl cis-trans isomerase [Candidatus Omnitrophica bacterium]|nr:peptidyl-prolyl cis-trans isomerase [Candidatus Omnitrophota bacterium]